MSHDDLKNKISKAPQSPGIYIFKGPTNKYLYIGKALNLKNRVKNYLKTDDPRLIKMISESVNLEFIVTDSDIEALILESQYIKKYQPPFNIMLRDDKQYAFVVFSEDEYPKIFITHQPFKTESRIMNNESWSSEKSSIHNSKFIIHNSSYIGPFTEVGALKTTLRLLRRIFPYCTCTQTHHNYCLNYHIGKCPGFCCLKKPELRIMNYELREYQKNIKAIKDILSGKKSSLVKDFEKEMKTLSKNQEYEKAQELQYKIEKIKRVFENARIIRDQTSNKTDVLEELKNIFNLSELPVRIECYDVANIQGKHAVGAMAVFSAKGGPASGGTVIEPDKNEYRKFKIYTKNTADDTGMLKEVLTRRFNHQEWAYPNIIVIDGGKPQLNIAKEVLRITNNELRIMAIALTKNEHHIGHKITMENKEISLSKLSIPLKNFLLQIDSEAHRFAISYYRRLHRKSVR